LTKEQWLQKLKGFVPAWVFEKEDRAEAIFTGLAAVLAEAHKDYRESLAETFIQSASEEFLNLHGEERSIERLEDESLQTYADRVRVIERPPSVAAIRQLLDAILINGRGVIIEHHKPTNFLNRGAFLNRNLIDFDVLYNAFTILIKPQIPPGNEESDIKIIRNLVSAINKNKAFGVNYRLSERASQE
jgi:hypothetical protein